MDTHPLGVRRPWGPPRAALPFSSPISEPNRERAGPEGGAMLLSWIRQEQVGVRPWELTCLSSLSYLACKIGAPIS